jgi:hypothetical protein
MPLLVQRVLGLTVKDLLMRAGQRPLAAAVLQLIVIFCIRQLGEPAHWLDLALQCGFAGVLCLAIVSLVGITGAERERFISEPLRRLAGRVGAINRGTGV